MDIWEFQARLTLRLSGWAAASIAGGMILAGLRHPFWSGFGVQSAGWGIVNGLIAYFGGMTSRKRRARLPDAMSPERQLIEKKNLSRLLWLNTCLDVLYVLGGLLLVRSRGRLDRRWRGQGWGIMLQGSFLFVFDLIHALLLRSRQP